MMDSVPYRTRALEKRKKQQEVIVVEIHIPKWLPGLLFLAIATKCGHMVYKRIRRRERQQKRELQESDVKRHKKFEEYKRQQRQVNRHVLPEYRSASSLDERRSMSLMGYSQGIDDSDSANEDSLSEYSRIPSPRERDHDPPLSQFQIFESCYEDYIGDSPIQHR